MKLQGLNFGIDLFLSYKNLQQHYEVRIALIIANIVKSVLHSVTGIATHSTHRNGQLLCVVAVTIVLV